MNNGHYFSNRSILQNDSTRLLPWRGYWVYAEKSGVELLINPAAVPPSMPMAKKTDREQRQWQVGFSCVAQGAEDDAFIGEASLASDGYDEFDSPKPPVISGAAGMGLLHSGWRSASASVTYEADIAGYSETNSHEWKMAITAQSGQHGIALSWCGSGLTKGFLYLRDTVAGATLDMRQTDTYGLSFLPGETRRVVTITYSSLADKRFAAAPTAWTIRQNAPNPFRIATIITYSIPGQNAADLRPRAVRITAFDVCGRRVRTLMNGPGYPGNYSVVWDGTDDRRRRLPQGMYLVHFQADGFSGNIRMHLVD
jgi:hypothetical protein